MSNVELARFLCSAMWHLASVVIWAQRGNIDRMSKSESEFLRMVNSLDQLEKGKDE